ncbi:MAG: putative secondary metabolism biosynthetic enzyme [Peltula sp. TS41687]|nr:MAG: putative secondary metabolism biosynthetic enzyme [Peltula sp. TS41687]
MAQVLTKAPKTGDASAAPALHFHSYEPSALGPKEVLVKFLAAPINPLDVLVLADVYPVKPQHQHAGEPIPGYDGVGEIVDCGGDVSELARGDLVIPSKFGVGTWRTHAVLDAQSVQKILRPSDVAFAAILRITIAPAFCLVEDMCNLKPGDWIIQNAATSVVAQMVVQFARRRGIHTINVIRDRPEAEADAVKQLLLGSGGADIVVTESELLEDASIKPKRVMLALDSVFGSSARTLVKALSPGGTFVQLGFLSGPKSELTLDANDLFGRQLTLRAFRGSAQVGLRTAEEQGDLFDWFIALFNAGELHLPALGLDKVVWDVADNKGAEETLLKAVKRAQQGDLGQRKQVIIYK